MRKEGVRRGGGWVVVVVGILSVGSEAGASHCGDVPCCGNDVCNYGPPDYEEVTCLSDCGCDEGSPNSCGGFSQDADGQCGCDANCWNASNLYGDCCPDACTVCGFGCTGACGNGTCGPGEDGTNCAADCGCAPTPAICGTTTEARDPDCRCDALCLRYGDCCADVCSVCSGICVGSGTCGNGTCDPNERAETCAADCGCQAAGMCGRQAPDGCWCDSLCLLIGDCCEDACTRCSRCENACGDGDCTGTETCVSCAGDCGACLEQCGNAVCGPGESCSICPADCGACGGSCPNGTCGPGETCSNCSADCGACPVCGSGGCQVGENCTNCPVDCGVCEVCGNGLCQGGETCSTCAADCGSGLFSLVDGDPGAAVAGSRVKVAMGGNNLYGTGTFTGVFRGMASYGGGDIAITKDDITNPASTWAKQGGSTAAGTGDRGFDIAYSKMDGSIYVVGVTDSGDTWFGRGEPGEAYAWSSGGDGFIAKFSASTGTLSWAKWFPYASPAYSEGRSVTVASDGTAIVAGAFNNSVRFGAGEPMDTTLTSVGATANDYNAFLARYNLDGTLAWARRILKGNAASPPVGNGRGVAVGVDGGGNLYVGGTFSDNVIVEAGPMSQALSSAGGTDLFLAKFDSSATTMLWARRDGGSGENTLEDMGVTTDGRVRTVGSWSGTSIAFGQGEPGQVTFIGPSVSDLFLAGYTSANPTVLEFARNVGGNDWGPYGESANGIAVGADGRSFITGTYSDSTTFGSSWETSGAPGIDVFGGKAAFVAKYDAIGTFSWVDYGWAVEGTGVAMNCDGSVMVAGLGSSPSTFFPGTAFPTAIADGATWVAKYLDSGPVWNACAAANITALPSAASGSQAGDNSLLLGGPGAGTGREKVYSWVAPSTGTAVFTTCGGAAWDTRLSAASGSCGGSQVADSDNACGTQSEIVFPVTSGTTYYIYLGGSNGQSGTFTLAWYMVDACGGANVTVLSASSGSVSGDTTGLPTTSGAVSCSSYTDNPTIYYAWRAPSTGNVTFSNCGGATWDTLLYATASSCAGTEVACADDKCGPSTDQSTATFDVTAGTVYYIRMRGNRSTSVGPFTLQWFMNCGTSTTISGASGSISGTTASAPGGPGCDTGTANPSETSFQWVAPATGYATFSTCPGATWNQTLTVWSGSCTTAQQIICQSESCTNGASVSFNATSGTTYYINVGGKYLASGAFTLQWYMDCDNATAIVGASGTVSSSTLDQPGGPGCNCCNSGTQNPSEKIFSWVAPSTGTATFNTCGSPAWAVNDQQITVFSGSCTGANIACVAGGTCGGGSGGSVSFSATSGTTYYIIIGGRYHAAGAFTLNWP